jgi:threonine/homoserine/homoserine lactone efflux protein
MPLLLFLLEVMLISLSGAMAPGPVTTVVLGKGSESPHAGAWVSIGHGIIEIPLMVALLYGVGRLLDTPYVKPAIALVGGLFLLFMAWGMFRSLRRGETAATRNTSSPVVAGILLTLGNPYFLVWWATVGTAMIMRSVAFGIIGFVAFAAAHLLIDFSWNYSLSALSFKGGQVLGSRFHTCVFLLCGLALAFFGGKLLVDGVVQLLA